MNVNQILKNITLKIIFIVLITIGFIILKSSLVLGTTNIPKVYFEGNISKMLDKKDERKISIKYESKDLNFETKAKIKIQGTSSLAYEKKNYTITFYKDSSYEEKEKIDVGKGWGAQSKYGLKANWIDKTHSRNIVSARITAKVQEKYGLFTDLPNKGLIDGYPVEIYSNNEFLGLYTWNIPKSDWMWGLDEDDPNNIALVGDDWTPAVGFKEQITTFEDAKWEVEIGEKNQDTIDKFNRLIRFVANSSDEEFKKEFELYVNKDAILNYIAMLNAMDAIDNYGKNMIMLTYDGKVWYPSLYDLDATWGTDSSGNKLENYDFTTNDTDNMLILRTMECFQNEVATRWFELREEILSKDNILNEFYSFNDSIPNDTLKKEKRKWKDISGYDIKQIEEFLDYRLKYIDDLMESKREVSEESTEISKTNENRESEEQNVSIEYNDKKNYENILYFFIIVVIICTILVYLKNN